MRAACHHAEAVRDEKEVGDRDGVAIGLEHTLLIGGVCLIYEYVGTAMRCADGMQTVHTGTCCTLVYFEEVRPAASTRAAPRPIHCTPPATLAAPQRRRPRRGVANGRASPTAV